MGHPLRTHCLGQNPLRHHSWRITRDLLDPYKHILHVRLLLNVSLRSRSALRLQRWGL